MEPTQSGDGARFAQTLKSDMWPAFLESKCHTIELHIPTASLTAEEEVSVVRHTLANLALAPDESFKLQDSEDYPLGQKGLHALMDAIREAYDSLDAGEEVGDKPNQFPGDLSTKCVLVQTSGLHNKFEPLISAGSNHAFDRLEKLGLGNVSSKVSTEHEKCDINMSEVIYSTYYPKTGITELYFDPYGHLCSGKYCSFGIKEAEDLYQQLSIMANSEDAEIVAGFSRLQGYTHGQVPQQLASRAMEIASTWARDLKLTCREISQTAKSRAARQIASKHLRSLPMTLEDLEAGAKLRGQDLVRGEGKVAPGSWMGCDTELSKQARLWVHTVQERTRQGLAGFLKEYYEMTDHADSEDNPVKPTLAQLSDVLTSSIEQVIKQLDFDLADGDNGEDEQSAESTTKMSAQVKINVVNQDDVPDFQRRKPFHGSVASEPQDYIAIRARILSGDSDSQSFWKGRPTYLPIWGSTETGKVYDGATWELKEDLSSAAEV